MWWCCCGSLCCLGGGDPWLMLTMLQVMSMRWAGRCVLLLFLPLAGGPVGGAGGVCSPAMLASFMMQSVEAPEVLLCAGVVVVVVGVL